MTGKLTPLKKQKIKRRVNKREDVVEDRLQRISSGRTKPDRNQFLLNESKKYRLGVVFIDINSFSDYVFENPDKNVLRMLNIFIPEVLQIVRDYGGIFEKNTGDGVLAYFGAGDPDGRATETILDFLATVKWSLANVINPLLVEGGLNPISISSGATYGLTYLSRIGVKSGNQEMNRLTAVSEIANIASRLEDEAEENQYLVGPRIKFHSNNWDSCFEPQSVLKYKWVPQSQETERYFQVHDFIGVWDSTKTENLKA